MVYVLGWQLVGASIFLLCAFVIFREVILPRKPNQSLGFWTSLILLLIPITIYMNAADLDRFGPELWGKILFGLTFSAFTLGILGVVLLFYLLPFGIGPPRWTRWVALLVTIGIFTAFGLLVAEIGGDFTWGLVMITLLVGIIGGSLLLVFRYRRYFTPAQKIQGRWITTALLVLPLWLVGSIASETIQSLFGDAASAMLELHLQLILPMLVPLAILHALLKLGLWEAEPNHHRPLFYAGVGTALFVGLVGYCFLVQSEARAASADLSQPWVLPDGQPPMELIVDTDLGNDDVLALLFLMQHPGVDLQAVNVVGTGLIHCEPGIKHVLGLLELSKYREIPVACGTEEPLDAEHAFPDAWRKAADHLWGLGLPLNKRQASPLSAPELLVETLMQAQKPLPVLALGPLTNLAQAFHAHPEVIDKIEHLYIMGGAVEVPGNVYDPSLGIDNRTAEWNLYADPLAARIVFESGVPITQVPLDATNYVAVNMPLYRNLGKVMNTRPAIFTFNVFYINQGWIQTGQYYLWDTLAAVVVTNPDVANYQDYHLQVITERGPDFGRTLATPDGTPVQVATWADAPLFEEIFVRVLNTE